MHAFSARPTYRCALCVCVVQDWPGLRDLIEYAQLLMERDTLEREPWMDDPSMRGTRDRWQLWLIGRNEPSISVTTIGVRRLAEQGFLVETEADFPIDKVALSGLRTLVDERFLWQEGDFTRNTRGGLTSWKLLSASECLKRLKDAGVETARVSLKNVHLAALRGHNSVKRAYLKYLHWLYRTKLCRDFQCEWSYPEWYDPRSGEPSDSSDDSSDDPLVLPMLLAWDEPHQLKGPRMACCHRLQEWTRWHTRTKADATVAVDVDDEGEDEVAPTFDAERAHDEDADDAALRTRGNKKPIVTLALRIALAVEMVIEKQEIALGIKADTQLAHKAEIRGQRILHPRSLDPEFCPQNVLTSRRLLSFPVADAMRQLGTSKPAQCSAGCEEEARFVEAIAGWATAMNTRGYAPSVKWLAWRTMDRAVQALHPSLRWQWTPPLKLPRVIEGFGRVTLCGFMGSNSTSRQLDIMLSPCRLPLPPLAGGDAGASSSGGGDASGSGGGNAGGSGGGAGGSGVAAAQLPRPLRQRRLLRRKEIERMIRLIYDRRRGSDLCECIYARATAKLGDKAPKRLWRHFFRAITRQTARQLMDAILRRSPMWAAQHAVYGDKQFVKGFRACVCTVLCQIGKECAKDCKGVNATNRHTKSEAKMLDRMRGTAPQPSIRTQAWKRPKLESSDSGAGSSSGPTDESQQQEDADAQEAAEDSAEYGAHAAHGALLDTTAAETAEAARSAEIDAAMDS